METVHLESPSALLRAAKLEESNLSQKAARLLALELYREAKGLPAWLNAVAASARNRSFNRWPGRRC
jgi:hypothetical protein